jgi:hypothetical protein
MGCMGRVGGGGGEKYCARCHFRALVMDIARLKIITYRAIKTTGQLIVNPSRHARQRSSPTPTPDSLALHLSFLYGVTTKPSTACCMRTAWKAKDSILTTCSSSFNSGFRDSMSANMVNLTLEGVLLQQINKTNNK